MKPRPSGRGFFALNLRLTRLENRVIAFCPKPGYDNDTLEWII